MTRHRRIRRLLPMAATAVLLAASLASAAGDPASGASASSPSTAAMAWGDNSAGELGNGTLTPSPVPVGAGGTAGIKATASGGRHNLALLPNGTVVAWGDNEFGQLGNGILGANHLAEGAIAVKGLSSVAAVAAGGEHSLALLSNGTVMAWGDNSKGQLGNGTTASSAVPVAVKNLTGVKQVAAGLLFTMALLSNGTVMTWGSNNSGQLGNGTYTDSNDPVAVSGLTGAAAIAAGEQHALALLKGGTAEAWGSNGASQLGDGDSTHGSSNVPVAVKNLTSAVALAAGSEHSVALESNGSVMVWGGNGFFQLARPNGFPGGVGTSNVPLLVKGIQPAKAVAAGGLFTLTITTTGAVQAWGDNAFGQLGNNSTSTNDVPVTVLGITTAEAVSAGGVHATAIVGGATSPAPSPGLSSIWRVQATQNPSKPAVGDFTLQGASSVAANDGWAVGTNGLFPSLPLAEHWDGTSWKTVGVAKPAGASQAELRGVDELSSSNAWAVGNTADSTNANQRTLIEHWNGSSWTVVPSPNPQTGANASDELEAIAGTGPNDLWAVGFFSDGINFIAMLFEHWNGTAWSFVPPPTMAGFQFAMAVHAISSNDVWVVGDTDVSTLSAHWNGTKWTLVPTPALMDGSAPQNSLTGVTATGPNNVWASGYESNVNQQNLRDPYLLHWTGSSWTLVKVPNPGTEGSQLAGVTALAPSDVWAVGETLQTDGSILSLAEHFDGTTWSAASSLDPGLLDVVPDSAFNAVASPGGHTLFAVGTQETAGRCCLFTLAEGTAAG